MASDEDLGRAMRIAARIIQEGDHYALPLFQRLEEEARRRKSDRDALARVLAIRADVA
ncbi:hypothetical protein [Tropicimonas sp. IMCC34043]|uniref:hypothetical protein n=1 Tax=Tropicimonas sp. IMCC34043 TaxID=2248760 RepID=UPI0013002B8B|nr:hypothetical protein [Tropicimonas sp. IMCC34043]